MTVLNPVLRRELTERWRGRRAVATLTLYLAALGGVCYLLYRVGVSVLTSQFGFGLDAASAGPVLGAFLVEGLLFFMLLLVLFIAPGYAAAQVSGERERRTLTLLQVTLLRPWQIVVGKLGAATAWLALLVVAALPLGAAAFFLGGVGIEDLLRGVLMILGIGIGVAALALGVSSLTRRTTASIVITYALVLGLTLGTLFLSAVEAVVRGTRGESMRTPAAMYLNPFFGLADAVQSQRASAMAFGGLPSPLGLFGELLPGAPMITGAFDNEGGMVMEERVAMPAPIEGDFVDLGSGEIAGPMPAMPAPEPLPIRRDPPRRPVWLFVLGGYLALGGLGLVVATRRLRIIEPRGRVLPSRGARASRPPR